jgi:TatD-related deoxyribonuclease
VDPHRTAVVAPELPPDTPVLDDHLHLDPDRGRGLDAVRDFARVGGTHLLLVNQPSWKHGIEVREDSDFQPVFEATIDLAAEATAELRGRCWPVLGVHPGLISRLTDDGLDPAAAADLMTAGLDAAAERVRDGEALALKSGRPHYDVSEAVWNASNRVLRHAVALAADADCALQLHTEATTDLTAVAGWARDAGLDPDRVVKHYADARCEGVTPSVMADRERVEAAVETGEAFLLETDFLDDPDRPGAVIGPKTVPRRTRWLHEEGHEEAIERAHVSTPRDVYGIDTRGTLTESE